MRSLRYLFLLLITIPCYAGKIRTIVVTAQGVAVANNYGTQTEFTFEYTVKHGKIKAFTFDEIEKYFTFVCERGSVIKTKISNGNYKICFQIEKYPSSFEFPDPLFKVHFDNGKGMLWDRTFFFEMDQRCPLTLDFRGENGTDGGPGKDRGAPILFRNGKDGYDGTNGEQGHDGHRLHIEMTQQTDTSLDFPMTFITVTDTALHKTFYYKTKYPELGILINTTGGAGGNGGMGGNGSSGKDGETTSKGTKDPGAGGNGGNGGQGGDGGNGGDVVVIVHPSAYGLENIFKLVNAGGEPGSGGFAGSGGSGGAGIGGGTAGTNGTTGVAGNPGVFGKAGDMIEIYKSDL